MITREIRFPTVMALRVESALALANAFVVTAQILSPQGRLIPIRLASDPAGATTRTTVSLPVGTLVGGIVTALSTSVTVPGENLVTVELWDGPSATANLIDILCTGYPTGLCPLLFGEYHERQSAEQLCAVNFSANQPAAGSEYVWTPTPYAALRVTAFKFLFTADANVANREIRIENRDASGGVVSQVWTGVLVTAGNTLQCNFALGAVPTNDAGGTNRSYCLPVMSIPPAGSLRTVTTNIQAGDQYSLCTVSHHRVPRAT